MPGAEKLRRAVEFLEAERASRPEVPLPSLVDEAARRFDLDAMQSEWLLMTAIRARHPEGGTPQAKG